MLNLIAPINTLGYGIAGYNILRHLIKLDNRVALYPVAKPEPMEDNTSITKAINNQLMVRKDFACVKIWHQNDLFTRVSDGKYFGFPIFELTEFNEVEKCSLKHCDEIMVCSKWAKEIILNNGLGFTDNQVHVIPLGVDRNVFAEQEHPTKRPSTVFFNCGKWEKRKGHDVLLECFNMAFEHNDDVELWMMCDNPFIGQYNQKWVDLYKNSKLGSKIKMIPRQPSQRDVYNVMSQADCGVFPARAEGWNLELLEMMSCGKHVITTNYSAHTEFCNQYNSMLVDVKNFETAFDGLFFDGKYGHWAEINEQQKEEIVEYMREAHNKKQSGNLGLNTSGISTAKQFSWERSAEEMLDVIGL